MPILIRPFNPQNLPASSYNSTTGECSIQTFLYGLEPYRVGPSTDIIAPWPLSTIELSPESEAIIQNVENQALDILHIHNIKPHGPIEGKGMDTRGVVEKDTMIICTLDTNTANWQTAADRIQKLLDAKRTPQDVEQRIVVEIRHPEEMYQDWSGAMSEDDKMNGLFERIQGKTDELVRERFGERNLIAVRFIHRVRDFGQREKGMPTLVVVVKWGVVFDWESARRSLVAELEECLGGEGNWEGEFAVEILAGTPRSSLLVK